MVLSIDFISTALLFLQYSNIEEFTADCVLLFDNACKYNEPDSLIYKDALTLQVSNDGK